MAARPTLVTPYGYSASTCGYCSPSGERSTGKTSKKYGLSTPQMSAEVSLVMTSIYAGLMAWYYQKLIDRGWRRSGTYVYCPDMARTCCPQYTIRLDAQQFKPSKKHRQVMTRWNRYLSSGAKPGDDETSTTPKMKDKGKGKAMPKGSSDWLGTLQEYEAGYGVEGMHRFETTLVPAKATNETFELYKRYQVAVHKDKPEDVTLRGFQRFLCDSPLLEVPISYPGQVGSRLPRHYGSYHLLYRVDGVLVGISVIDILPYCVSSVYFIWDPEWAWASLGKLSALREIALVREIREAGAIDMGWLYMGYWIPNCQKMRYKSEYAPSYLLDPGTHVFHLLDSKLDSFLQAHPQGYHPFTKACESSVPASSANGRTINGGDGDTPMGDEDSDEDPSEFPSPPPPGMMDPEVFSSTTVEKTVVLLSGLRMTPRNVLTLEDLEFGQPQAVRIMIRELIAALGQDMVANIARPASILDAAVLHFG